MRTTTPLGPAGEALAQKYLKEQGYAILATNWRAGKAEADIIAYREGLLVFVEVKTRTDTAFAQPEEAVNRTKQKAYIRLANAYVLQHQRKEEVRFDIITVVINNDTNTEIKHIPNAFSAFEL